MHNDPRQAPDSILVVDDLHANLRLLSQMLIDHGYGVRAVTSGARALASVQTTLPSLILLDIRMPEMDGFEVCRRLKGNAKTRDVPVIFISALDDIQDKMTGFALGGVDYITKPFQLEEVLARVETHLSLRRLQKQLQAANKRFEQELALAGSMQASFLPSKAPSIPGWQISMTLKPARETSGDFYDVYPLPDGQLALLVADVVDKGAAAALFMALSWSLIRTYEADYPARPEVLLSTVNDRILGATDGNRSVTLVYGVLNPTTGRLVYCNAGHNPPLHLRAERDYELQQLTATGTLLGMLDDQVWTQSSIEVGPGDVLVLYTDGVTEAFAADETPYGMERLVQAVRSNLGRSAREIQDAILDDVHVFLGEEPQTDDIALVIVSRELDSPSSS